VLYEDVEMDLASGGLDPVDHVLAPFGQRLVDPSNLADLQGAPGDQVEKDLWQPGAEKLAGDQWIGEGTAEERIAHGQASNHYRWPAIEASRGTCPVNSPNPGTSKSMPMPSRVLQSESGHRLTATDH